MTYRGTVRNGVVKLEGGNALPDGTVVTVEPVQQPTPDARGGRAKLKALAGVIDDLPSDLARNHDHYLHRGAIR